MNLRLDRSLLAALLCAAPVSSLAAQDCSGTSIGAVPISDLAGSYQGFPGHLYPGGANTPPAGHAALGQGAVQAVQPLDASGNPAADGKIVLVSIGMSNTTQEFSEFVSISDADPLRNPPVVVVDGAQGGQDARTIANPNAAFWANVDQRLANKGVTPQQVQIAWVKEAVARPTEPFPQHAQELRDLYGAIARILKQRYPNVQIAFYSSRIYAGYSTTTLNPEPYAYESGFGVKWMIERQIDGDPTLNADANAGPVTAPWLAWGPYLWADGLTPRSDGLIWECGDYAADGTHPGPTARAKVAQMLHEFFSQDAFAQPWYGGGGSGHRAEVIPYGTGCPGSNGPLAPATNSLPILGNTNFRVGLFEARPASAAVMFWSTGADLVPFEGCEFLFDFGGLLAAFSSTTNASGRTFMQLSIPDDPSIAGASLFVQWLVADPGVTTLPVIGGGAMSPALELVFGT